MTHEARERRRLKRYDCPGQSRFLTFSCFQNRPFLRSERACGWLADAIDRARSLHRFQLWAYVFMPTHAHLLILPPRDAPRVGSSLASIKLSVARRAVRWTRDNAPDSLHLMVDCDARGRVTHRFWQRGAGYDHNLWTAERIWRKIDYIHKNPVEAELCGRSEQWPWSSAPDYESTGTGPLALDLENLPARRA